MLHTHDFVDSQYLLKFWIVVLLRIFALMKALKESLDKCVATLYLEVKLRHPRRKTIKGKDVIRDENESRINLHVLYSQTVLITAGPSVTI